MSIAGFARPGRRGESDPALDQRRRSTAPAGEEGLLVRDLVGKACTPLDRQRQSGVESRRSSRTSLIAALVVLVSLSACTPETAAPVQATGPIIIISVDTLRADHLPVYGAKGIETPNLDQLAADSVVFENAYAQVPLTLPSHVSMLTGRLPSSTGVRNNLGYHFDASIPSIPALLKEKDYETAAVVSAYVLRAETGLGEAFDHYDDQMESSPGAIVGEIQRGGDETVSAALEWVRGRTDERYFLFLHLFDPHTPYAPPEPYASRYANRLYDGEIAAADAAVGRVLDHLRPSAQGVRVGRP